MQVLPKDAMSRPRMRPQRIEIEDSLRTSQVNENLDAVHLDFEGRDRPCNSDSFYSHSLQ